MPKGQGIKKKKVKINDSTSYRSRELWDYLGDNGYKCGVINMPMTYPPKKINGFIFFSWCL
jgi:predicted AlkP superfamily phosphohydrolase/phosphomutase